MAYHNIKENKESQFPIRLLKFILNKLKIKDLFKKSLKIQEEDRIIVLIHC